MRVGCPGSRGRRARIQRDRVRGYAPEPSRGDTPPSSSSTPAPFVSMRSAFEHETASVVGTNGFGGGNSREARHRRRDQRVRTVVVVLGPGVEAPAHGFDAPVLAPDHGRPRVAKPNPIAGNDMQPAPVEPNAVGAQRGAAPAPESPRVAENLDGLVAVKCAHDLGVDPADRLELAGPIGRVVGPTEPRRGVGFPLGGPRSLRSGRQWQGQLPKTSGSDVRCQVSETATASAR